MNLQVFIKIELLYNIFHDLIFVGMDCIIAVGLIPVEVSYRILLYTSTRKCILLIYARPIHSNTLVTLRTV